MPEDISVPVLSAGNWGGLGNHQRGNIAAWQRAGSTQKWLEMHGGTHWAGFYTGYGRLLQRRFFDHFLKAEGDWPAQPPVCLQVRHVDGSFAERAEQEWPLDRTQWRRSYLNLADSSLDREPPEGEAQRCYRALGDGLTLSTAPMAEETEITGPLSAKLWIASSTGDADLFLVLRAFGPDGDEVLFQGANDPRTPLSQGWLRASHRAVDPQHSKPWAPWHPHQIAEPLVPGRVYEVDVEIWATCVVLPKGYRLVLTILGRDFDHGLAAPGTGTGVRAMRGSGPFLHEHPEDRPPATFDNEVTVYSGGDRPSSLLVPFIDA